MECDTFVANAPCSSSECTNRENVINISEMTECYEIELTPLRGINNQYLGRNSIQNCKGVRPSWHIPLKAFRLVLLVAIFPALFIVVPVYMRYHVFSGQMYPVSMSDMRLIDKKVSTTWCQRQVLHSNAPFNAFLMPFQPKLANKLVPVSMTRHLLLEDDMKEYWGFYLLQGSIVTVSTCVRWPGASLIMIRGHKHLQECAYIGDDSSEELEEILEANGGKLDNATLKKLIDSPSNKPGDMMRQLADIQFHKPRSTFEYQKNVTRNMLSEEKDILDTKALKKILGHLYSKQHKQRTAQMLHEHIVTVPQLIHRYRDTNINEDEGKFLSFKDLEIFNKSNTSPNDNKNISIVESHNFTDTISNILPDETRNIKDNQDIGEVGKIDEKIKSVSKEKEKTNETNKQMDSNEVFEEIYQVLAKLGKRGKGVLNKLNQKLNEEKNNSMEMKSSAEHESKEENNFESEDIADKKLNILKDIITELLDKRKEKTVKTSWKSKNPRMKRDIIVSTAMEKELNEEDEKGNVAVEEGFEPDGYADHHSVINETTLNDMSKSEFWSSFSSSEEALLECDGLILNLPLSPHKECQRSMPDNLNEQAALANTITYRVPTNGYYFFVFNSENEIQTNYLRVKFDLQKTIYDLSNATQFHCKNSTVNCSMPLSFFSAEKVVLEVPVRDNDSLWNEEFVVMSECEPRAAIYLTCIIVVPIFIVIVAFQ